MSGAIPLALEVLTELIPVVQTFVQQAQSGQVPTQDQIAAAEAAIRESDAQWVAAARTASVDAWMAFYSADAVVMAPNVQMASDHAASANIAKGLGGKLERTFINRKNRDMMTNLFVVNL